MNFNRKILNEFVSEVREHLEAIESDLLAIEKQEKDYDGDVIDKIFRSIHTIKGNAGFFNLVKMNDISHLVETVLSGLRTGSLLCSADVIDALLEAVDVMGQLLDNIEDCDRVDIAQASALLNRFIPEQSGSGQSERIPLQDIQGADTGFEIDPELLRNIPPNHDYLYCLKYNVSELLMNYNIWPVNLVKRLQSLGLIHMALVKTPFRDLHEGLPENKFYYIVLFSTVIEPDLIAEAVLLEPGQIIQLNYPGASGQVVSGQAANELITDDLLLKFTNESLDQLDAAEKLMLQAEKESIPAGVIEEVFRLIHSLKGNAGFFSCHIVETLCMEIEEELDKIREYRQPIPSRVVSTILQFIDRMRNCLDTGSTAAAGSNPEKKESYAPIGQILLDMREITEEELETAVSLQNRKIGEILVAEKIIGPEVLDKALEKQQTAMETGRESFARYSFTKKDIRVDMDKLDLLFDLMGELVTAEAMIISHPDLEKLNLTEFSRCTAYLSKITREMQEITMSIRMIPLDGLFSKMNRLVRDLSRKFGKEVNIQISGRETEMDRKVIEEIADPLVHLIRNALDHGIEEEAVRLEKGKPATGTIRLSAKQEGNEIWITVEDDGAGLDRDKIIKKAISRGMVGKEADTLPDRDIWQFIFEPGFSTAVKVSEISGRGVGMDVVKRNIEKLRGKVQVSSIRNRGTSVIMMIPLTLAIIEGVVIRVGKMLFAIPIIDILEFHKAAAGQITRVDYNHDVLKLREDVLPVVRLYDFFQVSGAVEKISDGIIIICRDSGNNRAAFLADEIMAYRQIVIKALPEYMGRKKGICGCSIMGNGEINLVIDTGSVIKETLTRELHVKEVAT